MYAYTAYNVSENYLKPNGIDAQNVWDEMADSDAWMFAHAYWDVFFHETSSGEFDANSNYDELTELSGGNFNTILPSYLKNMMESMFDYYRFIVPDLTDFDYCIIEMDDMDNFIMDNITFTDERLALGAEVAEKIAASAE